MEKGINNPAQAESFNNAPLFNKKEKCTQTRKAM